MSSALKWWGSTPQQFLNIVALCPIIFWEAQIAEKNKFASFFKKTGKDIHVKTKMFLMTNKILRKWSESLEILVP